MPIDLDGIAVLNAVSKRPDIFPTGSDDINELARKTIETRITAKDVTLGRMREIAALLGETDLLQVLDSMSPSKIGKLSKKLDKEKPGSTEADSRSHRQHILALATGRTDPAPKLAKPAKAHASASSRNSRPPKRVKRTLSSKAMAASYKGKSSNDDH